MATIARNFDLLRRVHGAGGAEMEGVRRTVVRQDEGVARESVLAAEEWQEDPETGTANRAIDTRVVDGDEVVDGKLRVHSLSGHERNHLFLNHGGGELFSDVSAISALADAADARSFATLDYDRDGWLDIVTINASNPLARLYRNELDPNGQAGRVIALRLVGGNDKAEPTAWSNRDGYGARVELRKGGLVITREHRCGEGFAAQNSATILVGIGDWSAVDEIVVRWPSGKSSRVGETEAGSLVTVFERGEVRVEPYVKQLAPPAIAREERERFPLRAEAGGGASLRVWKAMATWCPSCESHLPQLEVLAERLQGEPVEFIGVPLDVSETEETLRSFAGARTLPYRLLTALPKSDRKRVEDFFKRRFEVAEVALPVSAVTDGEGEVLWAGLGVPTVSELRRLLREARAVAAEPAG